MLGTSRCAIVSLLAVGCSEPVREKPEPPDMDALVEGYAHPTRGFDAAAATEIQALLERRVVELVEAIDLEGLLRAALAALAAPPPSFAPVDLEGSGFATITRICGGHGDPAPPVDKDANGFLELTVGYTEAGLDPIVFGGAIDCREQIETSRLVIRGDVNLYIGPNLTLADIEQETASPVIFQLANFRLDVDDTNVIDGGLDFQVCRGDASTCVAGFVEMLFQLGGGTLVFFIDPATKTGGFRGSNGVWTCDFAAQSCTDGMGGVVAIPGYQL